MMKKIFPQSHCMMTFGLKIQFQTDIYVFMNTHSHIFCVSTPAHTAWTRYHTPQKMLLYHTMRQWISVTSQISRMYDNLQRWRHPWSVWCIWTLNMNYGLHKHLYSLTLSMWTYTRLYMKHTYHLFHYNMPQSIVSQSGACIKSTGYCTYLIKIGCVNVWHFGQVVDHYITHFFNLE